MLHPQKMIAQNQLLYLHYSLVFSLEPPVPAAIGPIPIEVVLGMLNFYIWS